MFCSKNVSTPTPAVFFDKKAEQGTRKSVKTFCSKNVHIFTPLSKIIN